MKRHVLSLLAAGAIPLAPAADARQLYWATYDYPVPSTIPTSSVSWRNAAVGDFDGDRHADFVSLVIDPSTGSGEVLFVQAPDVYQSLHAVGSRTATDLLTWTGAGTDKTDAFLSVGSHGASLWTLDTNDQIVPTTIVGSPLTGAKFIRGPVSGSAISTHAFGWPRVTDCGPLSSWMARRRRPPPKAGSGPRRRRRRRPPASPPRRRRQAPSA